MFSFSCEEAVVLHMAGYKNWNNDTKLEWLTMELGYEADIVEFSRKYLELFENTRTTEQKAACLQLYRKYANIAETTDKGEYEDLRTAQKLLYSKESQIPPRELQDFQALWDEDACKRCRECNARVDDDKIYCKKHENIDIACQRSTLCQESR